MSTLDEWRRIASGEHLPHLSETTRRRIREALERHEQRTAEARRAEIRVVATRTPAPQSRTRRTGGA